MRFISLLVDLHVSVNNTKPLTVAMESHCCWARKHFVLLQTIPTYLRLHVKCPIMLSDFKQIGSFSGVPTVKFQETPSCRSRADKWTRTDGQEEANRHLSLCKRTRLKTVRRCRCGCTVTEGPARYTYVHATEFAQHNKSDTAPTYNRHTG
jgi:hypothetical protein